MTLRTLAILAIGLLAASPAAAREIVVYNDASEDIFLPAPGGPHLPGALILWNSALTDAAGKELGSSAGQCIQVDIAGAHLCHTVFYLVEGALVLIGRQEVEPKPSLWIVTDGSGFFVGAKGEAVAVPVEGRARFRYTITLKD